jgi:hypothetical protein
LSFALGDQEVFMNNWINGTILLIVVAGWVFSALKKREPPRGLRAVAPPPRDDDDPSAPPRRRRTASEVDKFLEEVRRRRESIEGRKPEPSRPPVMPPVAMPPVARPPESRMPPPLPRRVPQPPRLAPPGQQPRRTAEVVVAEAVRPEIPEVVPDPPITFTNSLTNTTSRRPALSAVNMRQTLALLKNRESLISAMVLQEILQKPVSQRRGFVRAQRR